MKSFEESWQKEQSLAVSPKWAYALGWCASAQRVLEAWRTADGYAADLALDRIEQTLIDIFEEASRPT